MPPEYLNILTIINSNPNGLTMFDILHQYQEAKFKPENNTVTMNRKLFSLTQSKTIRFVDGKEKTYMLTNKGKQTLTKETK